jgi:hypothetical protein
MGRPSSEESERTGMTIEDRGVDPRKVLMSEPRAMTSVLAHVQAERTMQTERYGWRDDARLRDDEWDALITSYLRKPGATRYVRLVQVAALAIAAAEREPTARCRTALSEPSDDPKGT